MGKLRPQKGRGRSYQTNWELNKIPYPLISSIIPHIWDRKKSLFLDATIQDHFSSVCLFKQQLSKKTADFEAKRGGRVSKCNMLNPSCKTKDSNSSGHTITGITSALLVSKKFQWKSDVKRKLYDHSDGGEVSILEIQKYRENVLNSF